MSSDDEYLTIATPVQAEIKIKGSRFIGSAAPAQKITDAEQFIRTISRKYYNATHNCFAFQLKIKDQVIQRSSDAGEPAGTAGPPILNVISGRKLFNIVVVVTRYFGGTKLGKGGLIRAYTECTQNVLDKAKIITKINLAAISLAFPYNFTGNVMHFISQIKGNIISSRYDQQVELTVELPAGSISIFKEKVIETTSGKVDFK